MRIGTTFSVEGNMPDWSVVSKRFGYFAYRLLANVGMKAARSLYRDWLEPIFNPRSFSSTGAPLSDRGRPMISYSVDKNRKSVIIRSFPLNVLRYGPGPRTAKRTLGGRIFRGFGNTFDANAAALDVLDKLLNGKDGLFEESQTDNWETKLRKSNTNRSGEI
jgi:hypothetical protein